MDKLFNLTLGSSIVHFTTDPAPVPHIFYISLQTQYRSSVYSIVHHRHSTSSPNTLHSTTVKVPVLRIHYNSLNTQHQTYVCFPVQYRPSTIPAYTVQSTTNRVPVPRIQSPTDPAPVLSEIHSTLLTKNLSCVYSTGHYSPSTSPPYTIFLKDLVPVLLISTSPPYTLQSTIDTVPVLRILYNPLETQYQSVFSTVHYRPCSSTSYTLHYKSSVYSTILYRPSSSLSYIPQSTTNTVPVLCILSTVHYRTSTSPPYILQSITDQVPVLCILYSKLQIQYQSSVYSSIHYSTSPPYTVHYRPSTSPLYTLQSITNTVPVLRILYSQLQNQYQSSIYYAVHYRPSTSPPYTLQSTTDTIPVFRILYSQLQTQYQSSVYFTTF